MSGFFLRDSSHLTLGGQRVVTLRAPTLAVESWSLLTRQCGPNGGGKKNVIIIIIIIIVSRSLNIIFFQY